jgi:hypothetical protein
MLVRGIPRFPRDWPAKVTDPIGVGALATSNARVSHGFGIALGDFQKAHAKTQNNHSFNRGHLLGSDSFSFS